ncbi:MAG: pseudouridine synthase [Bacteroidales bacterium]|nr:pseudouridine synthase [Bacteroidales bacterium]
MTPDRFHKFAFSIADEELPERFTNPFNYAPHPLVVRAADELCRAVEADTDLAEALAEGKMLGVLVVRSDEGIGFVAAYSGVVGHSHDRPYFVPPIYNQLAPDGFFVEGERRLGELNAQISNIIATERCAAEKTVDDIELDNAVEIRLRRSAMAERKAERDRLRRSGNCDEQALIRESQHDKAEFKRLQHDLNRKLNSAAERLADIDRSINTLKQERRRLSIDLQKRLFDRYQLLNARGDVRSLCDIFRDHNGELPPAAAGDCAAPRLLQYAYANRLLPIAMGEFWWGRSPANTIRHHRSFYPSCSNKCKPILGFMLQGLDVEPNPDERKMVGECRTVYEDRWLWVVDKPSGMLSVPGRIDAESVADIARKRYGDAYPTHRLDMDTSGLLIVAKDPETLKTMRRQFELREVEKEYVAIVGRRLATESGRISLPLIADIDRRPYQKVDIVDGLEAVTDYHVEGYFGDHQTLVRLNPRTGRTHQLRVHAAHPDGLNAPIVGDRLYGDDASSACRLMLHARRIAFTHPATGERITLTSEPQFYE